MSFNIVSTILCFVGYVGAHFWGRYIGSQQERENLEAKMDQAFEEGIQAGLKKAGQ